MQRPELPIAAAWHATRPNDHTPLTSADGVRVQRALETQGDGFRIRVRFVNASGGSVRLHSLSPALVEGESEWFADGLAGWVLWLHGAEMTSPALTHRLGRAERHDSFPGDVREMDEEETRFRSHGMMLLHHPSSSRSLLLGFITTARQFGEIVLACSPDERRLLQIDARCITDGVEIADGGSLESESVVLLAGDDPLALVDEYARLLGQTMRARVAERTPSGWCSWSASHNRISERDLLANLVALQINGYQVDYVQIDAGFQSATGDWLIPNERFPRGMAFLAGRIRDAGFRPGLWLAPLMMHRDSRILAEHPEFALRDQSGAMVWSDTSLGPCAVLDCTNPDAQTWLFDTVRTIVHEWGYAVLKLDALTCACQPGARYHTPRTTAAGNLRAGLATIRAAAGDGTFLIGCSCPFGPAIGIVDAMRVGPDVDARWFAGTRPSVKHALRLALQRFWMHRRLWLNDPDCFVTRGPDSSLSQHEAEFLATGIALSGGLAVLTDDLAALPSDQAAIGRRILPSSGLAARPLDLFEREPPAIWRLPRIDGAAIALLNWTDDPVDLTLPGDAIAPSHHAVERWSERPRSIDGATHTEHDIAPHSARVVRFYSGDGSPPRGGHILA
ncbi:MAG: glycoside hydrolase family 36 protein [Dehalococcoidia bacterium]